MWLDKDKYETKIYYKKKEKNSLKYKCISIIIY